MGIGTSYARILENCALAHIDNRFNLHYNKHYCESLFTFVNINMSNGRVFQNAVLINLQLFSLSGFLPIPGLSLEILYKDFGFVFGKKGQGLGQMNRFYPGLSECAVRTGKINEAMNEKPVYERADRKVSRSSDRGSVISRQWGPGSNFSSATRNVRVGCYLLDESRNHPTPNPSTILCFCLDLEKRMNRAKDTRPVTFCLDSKDYEKVSTRLFGMNRKSATWRID